MPVRTLPAHPVGAHVYVTRANGETLPATIEATPRETKPGGRAAYIVRYANGSGQCVWPEMITT